MVSAKMADANVVASLRRKLVHPETSLSQKYRVLFSLRNIPGAAAEQAIVEGHTHSCCSLSALYSSILSLRYLLQA